MKLGKVVAMRNLINGILRVNVLSFEFELRLILYIKLDL